MQLSNSGRVVLIDDEYDEAQPLMEALAKHSIPYLYFDGDVSRLPSEPLAGIRFVFLDIVLQGMEGQDDKTKASGITGRLRRIISDSNGPYVIIFWTHHKEICEKVIENCQSYSIAPVNWLLMEKKECSDSRGNYDIQKITDSLKIHLDTIGAFQLYVLWENILHSASTKFVHDFASLVEPGDTWSDNTAGIFYKLYKAFVDKNEVRNKNEQFRCSCHLINRSFLDILEDNTNKNLNLPDSFILVNRDINPDIRAKLNSSLFLGKNILSRPVSGCVFSVEDEAVHNALKQAIFKPDRAPAESKLCEIIITPECDIAQKKTVQFKDAQGNDSAMHRVVHGLLFSVP